jgi:hypothetical protein
MFDINSKNDEILIQFITAHFPITKMRDGKSFKRAIKIPKDYTGQHTMILFVNDKKFNEIANTTILWFVKNTLGYTDEEIKKPLQSYLYKIK